MSRKYGKSRGAVLQEIVFAIRTALGECLSRSSLNRDYITR